MIVVRLGPVLCGIAVKEYLVTQPDRAAEAIERGGAKASLLAFGHEIFNRFYRQDLMVYQVIGFSQLDVFIGDEEAAGRSSIEISNLYSRTRWAPGRTQN